MNATLNFCSVSDVHILNDDDQSAKLLRTFLKSKDVLEIRNVFFLGDIFDFLVGPYDEYLEKFPKTFTAFKSYLKKGKLTWFEGNHDFHFMNLMPKFLNEEELSNFTYVPSSKVIDNTYFSHGDELDVLNIPFMRYRKLIKSSVAKFLVEKNILSYKNVNFLYLKFSKKSKKSQKNFSYTKSREHYKDYAQQLLSKNKYKNVILGHSHIPSLKESYFNSGLFEKERKYLRSKENRIELVTLEESSLELFS